MSNLHIVVNRKWFDLIKAGVKREEYREIKGFWATRFVANRDNSPIAFDKIAASMLAENIKDHSASPPDLSEALAKYNLNPLVRHRDLCMRDAKERNAGRR